MMKKITVNLKDKSYPILIQRGLLNQVGQYLEGHRKDVYKRQFWCCAASLSTTASSLSTMPTS